jgi:hypothetical protein
LAQSSNFVAFVHRRGSHEHVQFVQVQCTAT